MTDKLQAQIQAQTQAQTQAQASASALAQAQASIFHYFYFLFLFLYFLLNFFIFFFSKFLFVFCQGRASIDCSGFRSLLFLLKQQINRIYASRLLEFLDRSDFCIFWEACKGTNPVTPGVTGSSHSGSDWIQALPE